MGWEKQEKVPRGGPGEDFDRALSALFLVETAGGFRLCRIIRLLFANMLWFPQVL
jgi:hypothetical protein